jgi:hypothetical protein
MSTGPGSASIVYVDAGDAASQASASAAQAAAIADAATKYAPLVQDGFGGSWVRGEATELVVIAAAATTDTVGNLLPANSVIRAVAVRVTVLIPTAATFKVGDATTDTRFATGVLVAAGTTNVGLTHVDQTGAPGPIQAAAAKVRITPNLTPGAATGRVRVTVYFDTFVAPTS